MYVHTNMFMKEEVYEKVMRKIWKRFTVILIIIIKYTEYDLLFSPDLLRKILEGIKYDITRVTKNVPLLWSKQKMARIRRVFYIA